MCWTQTECTVCKRVCLGYLVVFIHCVANFILATAIPDSHMPGLVDLTVRSYAGDAGVLHMLLRSIELFWPASWQIHVTFDAEETDDDVASTMPAWVNVTREPLPTHYAQWPPIQKYGSSGIVVTRGYQRGEYGRWLADVQGIAPYVAVVDSDVVLVTSQLEHLYFAAGKASILVGCPSGKRAFIHMIRVLGFDYVGEFMGRQPFFVKRPHFQALRSFVTARYCERKLLGPYAFRRLGLPVHVENKWKRPAHKHVTEANWTTCLATSWDAVWLWLALRTKELGEMFLGTDEMPFGGHPNILLNLHVAMGHFIWHYHRAEYTFSMQCVVTRQQAAQHSLLAKYLYKVQQEPLLSCPLLTGAKHVWSWSHRLGKINMLYTAQDLEMRDMLNPVEFEQFVNIRRERDLQCARDCGKSHGYFVELSHMLMAQGRCLERHARGDTNCRLRTTAAELLGEITPSDDWIHPSCATSSLGNMTMSGLIAEHMRLLKSLKS